MAGCNAFQQGNTYYIMVRQGRRAYKQKGGYCLPRRLPQGRALFVCMKKAGFQGGKNMSDIIQNMSDIFRNMCLVFFICSEGGITT